MPFLKVDKGLASLEDGVQVMKPINGLDELLDRANQRNIFGTKMRSFIKEANPLVLRKLFSNSLTSQTKFSGGLIPIIEPEVDIHSADKAEAERLLKEEIMNQLSTLGKDVKVMFKLSLPTEDNFYRELTENPHVVRVVALSGGYTQAEANENWHIIMASSQVSHVP